MELRSRSWQVTLPDAGSIPHPDASSTDANKVDKIEEAQHYGLHRHFTDD